MWLNCDAAMICTLWQFFRELRDLSVQLVRKETKFGCGSAEIDDVQDLARRATVRDAVIIHRHDTRALIEQNTLVVVRSRGLRPRGRNLLSWLKHRAFE